METKERGVIDFSRTIYEMRKHWRWYVAALVLFVGFGIFYMYKKNPVYLFHANIVIDQNNGGSSPALSSLMSSFSLGGFSAGSVDDELLVIRSHSLMEDLVRELKLNRTYIEKDGVKNLPLYKNSPVEVLAPDAYFDTLSRGFSFRVNIRENGLVDIKVKDGLFSTMYESAGNKLPFTVSLPNGGRFVFEKTKFFEPGVEKNLVILVSDNAWMAETYMNLVSIGASTKLANGITCEIEDNQTVRGKDVLNKIIELYNERRMDDNYKKTQTTLKFINERLASLTTQLESSEQKLQDFKVANNITDLTVEAQVLLEQTSASNQALIQYQTQMGILDMVVDFLENPANKYSLIPVAGGIDSDNASSSIASYNELVLQRMQLDMSAKGDNKALQLLNAQIDAMRSSVIETMKKAKQSAQIAYADYDKEYGKNTGRLRSLSSHEREFVDLTRDREIKNTLYIFLLEQQENYLLKIGTNMPMSRIIDMAYRDVEPIAPKASIVLLGAVLLALILPTLWCVYRTFLGKKMMIKSDWWRMSNLPFAAQIPYSDRVEVDFTKYSAASAGFRDLLGYMVSKQASMVNVTSVADGDGNCFVVSNLARLAAFGAKRVCVVSCDPENMLKMSLAASNSVGIADYVLDKTVGVDSVIAKSGISDNLDVVLSSTGGRQIPEMLISNRFVDLLKELRQRYDLVIVSMPAFSEGSYSECFVGNFDETLVVVRSGQNRKAFAKLYRKLIGSVDAEHTAFVLNAIKL